MKRHPASAILRWLLLLAALLICGTTGVVPAQAQAVDWREQRTTYFAILYPPDAGAAAAQYASFVDGVYTEISAIFNYSPATPITLRIYPTLELYEQINPLAAQVPGVVAHAHTGRREISIALPQTEAQPHEQIVNNVRHELAHIIAADLSGNRLTTAFQEGIAQYVEHPGPDLEAKMRLMRQIIDQGQLLPWSELNRPGVAYSAPQISYPQSYTIVAFLIERDGMATFRRFLEASRTSSGYRSALATAYGVSAEQLEQEWRAWLDAFVNGGYRRLTASTFDLTAIEATIARGDYEAARAELERIVASLQQSGDRQRLAQAEALLQRAGDGLRALRLTEEARAALTRGEYDLVEQHAAEAARLFAALGQPRRRDTMETYRQLAAEGRAAQQQVVRAQAELRTLRVWQARDRLLQAYVTFLRLGDEAQADQVRQALRQINAIQTMMAVGLVVLAALLLGWNIQRRFGGREPYLPFA